MTRPAKSLPGFTTIRTSSLLPMYRLPVDIFVPVTDRPVRYAPAGSEIEKDRIDRLKKFRFAKVFIRIEDEERYRKFLSEIMEEAENGSASPLADRTLTVVSGSESATEEIVGNPTDKLTFESSVAEFERFSRFLARNEESLATVLKQSGKAADYVSHGIQVAALSLLIAQETGLPGLDAKRNSLLTGCCIHDIAAEVSALPFVRNGARSGTELELWKNHPAQGRQFYSDKDWVNLEILNIIGQHEELPSGAGFPNGLNKVKMDPLAIIASLANRYDECAREFDGDFEATRKEFVLRNLSHFDLGMVEALIAAMKRITASV